MKIASPSGNQTVGQVNESTNASAHPAAQFEHTLVIAERETDIFALP
jgi:methionine aminopeptidase